MRLFIIASILSFITVQSVFAQSTLTADDWIADLEFLSQTVHQDYSFLFKKTTAEKFDSAVSELKQEIPNLEEHEVIVGLARIVSLFEYGHTSISVNAWYERDGFDFHQMAFQPYAFKDGIFIQGTKEEYAKALGAKILKVEGVEIEKALAAVKPVFPTENNQFFKAYGLGYIGNAQVLHAQGITPTLQNSVTLTLEKDGKVFDQKFESIKEKGFPGQYGYIKQGDGWLDARDQTTTPLYLKNLDKIYYYEYLPEKKAVYVRHSQIQDDPEEDIPAFYDRVFKFVEENDVEKFVLDVRLNGGGNNYKNKPIVTGLIQSKVDVPGKLFVILGRKTYSACQNLVNELHNYTNAIFIGEPTGENINFYGDNRRVTLPYSKIPVRLSFAWWQDKPQWENDEWLAPHMAVDMSFEEYKTNRDPVLDAALEFSSENFISDPMTYLSNLYTSGQQAKLQSEALRIVNDPVYQFFDFEGEFNTLGYDLLGRGDTQTAIAVFGFVVQLFPESANAWDSFAEGHWKAGDLEKAEQYYNKAISLDPEGNIGDNARSMLEKMKSEKK